MADAQTVAARGGNANQVQQAQTNGQAHQAAAVTVRRAVHAAAVHTKVLSDLNAPDSNGRYGSCSPLYVFDRSAGAAQLAPHAYDGCDRNPGGICHNPGGGQQIDCQYQDAIPGPPAGDGEVFAHEYLHNGHCTVDCLWNTLTILSFPLTGGEEAAAEGTGELVVDGAKLIRDATEGSADAASSGTTLFRAVGPEEAVDIGSTGTYRIAGNSVESGKYFFLTQEQAQAMVDRGWATHVTSGVFPQEAIDAADALSLPTEGPGIFIPSRFFPWGPVDMLGGPE